MQSDKFGPLNVAITNRLKSSRRTEGWNHRRGNNAPKRHESMGATISREKKGEMKTGRGEGKQGKRRKREKASHASAGKTGANRLMSWERYQ